MRPGLIIHPYHRCQEGSGMAFRFFPKEVDFFAGFEKAGRNIIEASTILVELFDSFDKLPERVARIQDIEHDNDDLTHETMKQLGQTFVTPIDREDIHALASSMDDVLDFIWAAGDRVLLFKVAEPRPGAAKLARSLKQNTEVVHRAMQELRRKKYAACMDSCIEINRLENEADTIFREEIARLFTHETDPILIIKWKEILEHLELATDKCEDVANTIESVVLKHA
jgi:predicted phosphate transport protein (TIGR00153 family)